MSGQKRFVRENVLHALPAPHRPQGFGQWARRLLIGRPLATEAELAHRLPILLALPVFASDALSSNAYATDEIMIQLASAGPEALRYVIPISVAISLLMVIVATSYRRAVLLYPTSGGSYTVARENLGAIAGLVAGSALVIDYILTVAVSVSAGIAAVTSYLPQLQSERVWLGLVLIVFITWINLRGAKESATWFAVPAYAFVGSMAVLLLTILYRYLTGQVTPLAAPEAVHMIQVSHGLTTLLVLKAFSNGCAALTGVEAISNGVQAFQPPEAKNAAKTLLILIVTSIVIFMGLGLTAHLFRLQPSHAETLISQLSRAAFSSDSLFPAWTGQALRGVTLASVLAVLIIASNTAFAGLPRLLALMARDGYAPRVLLSLGDRLVYSRGIRVLALVSAALVWAFQASVTNLIPLYAVGVFICFTLSQTGMLRRIMLDRLPGWQGAALLNFVGATVTGIVAIVISLSKFAQGAWVVLLLIPALIVLGLTIRRHYQWFEHRMTVRTGDVGFLGERIEHLTVVVLLSSDVHRGTIEGIETARALVQGRKHSALRALHIATDPAKTTRLIEKWECIVQPKLGQQILLDIVPSPYRTLIQPVVTYVRALTEDRPHERVVIMIPEFETGSFFSRLLHNQTAPQLRRALFKVPGITVITNRFFLQEELQ
jgi:amino acid transporter